MGDGEGMVIVRVCTHENKINYRGGFAQARYQLTGEFNTIKKRQAACKKIFWDDFSNVKFLRAEPGLQPGSKKLRSYLVPRFLPSFGLPPPKFRHFPAFNRLKKRQCQALTYFIENIHLQSESYTHIAIVTFR